jgi:hypothetical protein
MDDLFLMTGIGRRMTFYCRLFTAESSRVVAKPPLIAATPRFFNGGKQWASSFSDHSSASVATNTPPLYGGGGAVAHRPIFPLTQMKIDRTILLELCFDLPLLLKCQFSGVVPLPFRA